MTAVTYTVRLFGGRNVGVAYDAGAGTISIFGVTITLSTLSAALQSQWANAVANSSPFSRPAFGGDNVSQAVGSILDASPSWRSGVQTGLATSLAMNPLNDPEQFTH